MELSSISCTHLHYIQAIKDGEFVKVSNVSHGRPGLRFKKLSDLYESGDANGVGSTVILLPKEELSYLKSEWSSSGSSRSDVDDEMDGQMDDASLDALTIGQMREMFKSKKRKQQNHLNDTKKNGVLLTIKKEEVDEDELREPLIILKTNPKDSIIGKRRCEQRNIKTPGDAEVVPTVPNPCLEPAPQSPSNYGSSIVVKIEDHPQFCPADVPCTVEDSDVPMEPMVPDSTEDIKPIVDFNSHRDLFIVYTSQEITSTILPDGASQEAIVCDLDSEIYNCKEAEICVVNEVLHEKIGHDLLWDDNDADSAAVDPMKNEETSTGSLLLLADSPEVTQTDLPTYTLKTSDEGSVTGDLKMSLKGSGLSSDMTSSATLQPNEDVSQDIIIQSVDKIEENLQLHHDTVAVTASHGGSSSSKLEQGIQNKEVQFEDSRSGTLFSSHEMSFMGVWNGRSSSGEHQPDIPVFQDGEVRSEDGSRDDHQSTHEMSDTCVSSEWCLSQELRSEKQDFQNNGPLILDRSRERLQSSQQTSDTGIFRETASLSEQNKQDCRDREMQADDKSGESLQSSHQKCATKSTVPSCNSAESPILLTSSGFCSPHYDSVVDVMGGLSQVKVCEDADINNSADAPFGTDIDASGTESRNDLRDWRLQRSSGRVLCARKVISPKSQERLRKLLGSAEFEDDKNDPRRKLIFQKLVEKENPGVPNNKGRRAELPSSPTQLYRKQKNQTRRLPARDVYKTPPSSVVTPTINSVQRFTESAIAFSQRQMQDIDSLTSTLMNELNVMKDIIEENIFFGNSLAGSKTYDEMRDAIDNASKVKETARKWLSMMARDCNRFCKIMRLTEDGGATLEKCSSKESKKIMFADEAGGELCQVKYIEDIPSALVTNVKEEAN